MRRLLFLALPLALVAFFGCRDNMPPDPGSSDPVRLGGKVWRLESIETSGGTRAIDSFPAVTLIFAEEELGGVGPCNAYSAAYTASGNVLSIGEIGATKRLCQRGDLEREYFTVLEAVESFMATTDRLRLFADGGTTVLNYGRIAGDTTIPRDTTRPPAGGELLGRWRLRLINDPVTVEEVDTVVPIVLTFLKDSLRGSVPLATGGTGPYTGFYEASADGALSILELHVPFQANSTATRYFDFLRDAAGYHATAAVLVVYVGPGMSLVFDRAPETPPLDSAWLEFTEWRLRRMSWMDGGTVMVRAIDTPLVTLFFARNRFEGQGFCNSYSGDYQGQTTPNEGQLWIKSFTATEKACREYPLEARYFAMLAASPTQPLWTRYRVTTETLVLTSERGTLEYVRLR